VDCEQPEGAVVLQTESQQANRGKRLHVRTNPNRLNRARTEKGRRREREGLEKRRCSRAPKQKMRDSVEPVTPVQSRDMGRARKSDDQERKRADHDKMIPDSLTN